MQLKQLLLGFIMAGGLWAQTGVQPGQIKTPNSAGIFVFTNAAPYFKRLDPAGFTINELGQIALILPAVQPATVKAKLIELTPAVGQVTFTLPDASYQVDSLRVYVNGIRQRRDAVNFSPDFLVNGTLITFAAQAMAGDSWTIEYLL